MTGVHDHLRAVLADRYRIIRELGAGGMATVYLAQDLRHDRKVALKVLKPELAALLGAERFVAEIRTTASLQHPHILPLFDSGNADGFLYFVMPFIQGESLRERLNRETQLGVDESVRISREVADALDYAHRQGVIHRDIKPENILLHDGRPVVADFGIALAVSAAAGGRMTETGLSLGTPHYMSPEQATADKDITARSDIYSLASVLYEMLAGQPPHLGGSAQQIVMKIIAEPVVPVTQYRRSVPPNVAAALGKALEKLAADRFESAKAFSDALGNPAFTAAIAPRVTAPVATKRLASRLIVAGTALALLAAGALAGVAAVWRGRVPDQVVRFRVRPPPGTELYLATRSDVPFALSPDGSRIVFVARKPEETINRLYARRIDQLDAVAIAGTEGALSPFFSPDGRSIGFVTPGGAIRRVDVDGGPAQTIDTGPALTMSAPTWGDDGLVMYLGTDNRLHRVSSAGGRSQPVGDQAPGDSAGRSLDDSVSAYPSALPDGQSVLVSLCPAAILRGGGTCGAAPLAVRDLTSGRQTLLGIQAIRGWYTDGYLLYVTRDGTLFAATFDVKRRVVTSDPVGVLDGLTQSVMVVTPQIDVSASGALAYLPGRTVEDHAIVQVDRRGHEEVLIAAPGPYRWARLSPDQTRIAIGKSTDRQIYIYDRRSGTTSPVTFGGFNQRPTWSPDGRRVAFISTSRSGTDVWAVGADGAEPAKAIAPGKDVVQQSATFWTADGAWIVIDGAPDDSSGTVGVGDDIFALPASGNGPLQRVVATAASEQTGEVSPDGRWIAYVSDDAGDFQVYVQPFLRPGGRTLVSTGPAIEPAWASNNEITFTSLTSDSLVLATLDFGTSIGVKRVSLFDRGRYAPGAPSWREYDVSRDGQRFLFEKSLSRNERAEPVIVLHWLAEVRRAVAKQARRR
jgi:serine/threonine-protein kinase